MYIYNIYIYIYIYKPHFWDFLSSPSPSELLLWSGMPEHAPNDDK